MALWEIVEAAGSYSTVVIMLLVAVSSLMYTCENAVQPEAFSNILDTMWWAVATLTTIAGRAPAPEANRPAALRVYQQDQQSGKGGHTSNQFDRH